MNKQIRESLAIHGGRPVRTRPFRPTHDFGEKDATAVSKVIMSGLMGRGPVIDQFEAEAEPLLAAGAEVLIPAGGLPMLLLCRDPELRVGGAPVLNGVSVLLKLTEAAVRLRRVDGSSISRKAAFAKPSPEALREYLDHA